MTQAATVSTEDREIIIKRSFHATIPQLWRAWSDPALIGKWFGPDGFTTDTSRMEFREGGVWEFLMTGPDGRVWPNFVRYEVIEENARIVYSQAGAPDEVAFRTEVRFERLAEGQCSMTLRMMFKSAEDRDRVIREVGAIEGGIGTVSRLGRLCADSGPAPVCVALPSDREIIIARDFDASRELVWRAMTEPALLERWMFLPPGWRMSECAEDVRPGGRFQWAWVDSAGAPVMAMGGEYREVAHPERIVRTERFEFGCQPQAGEQLVTMTLEERPAGRTALRLLIEFPSREARDGMLASGMDEGMSAGYGKLDGLLASAGV
ncbi:MAG: SRPBCC domain-containing protein [Candidatus Sumerlaeia bacterium]|nr:SRPBCC domain-containing protein [Candidatus Sumerlaeia bacterium]